VRNSIKTLKGNKMKNRIKWETLALVCTSFLFLIGCGGGGGDGESTSISYKNTGSGTETVDIGPAEDLVLLNETCVEDYFRDTVSPIINACYACHVDGGVAQNTDLVFDASSVEDNFQTLKTYILVSNRKVIEKADGTKGHAGGTIFTTEDVEKMNVMVDYVANPTTCKSTTSSAISPSSIVLASSQDTLHSVASIMLGRAPAENELNMAINTTGLDNVVNQYMNTPEFYGWIRRSFNDFLLTDSTLTARSSLSSVSSAGFNDSVNWYDDIEEEDGRSKSDLRNSAIKGAARAPLELVVHVIKQNKPFSEILTADYTMMNPYSSRSYGKNISGFSFQNDSFTSGFSEDNYRPIKLDGIPQAGLLSDPVFLTQFPTTTTNANRHRSTKVQKFFLNTDILALADRPIDSTEESEDPHPTMTNPDCTICHIVMEPISGAFKNYRYGVRYQKRTWYDNMQEPGLSINNLLPDEEGDRALQWLSQEIIKDDRFARSIVHIFYTALTGREPLKLSMTSTLEYTQALAFEDEVFSELAQGFRDSNMNAKSLIKEIIKSPLFRGIGLPSGEYNPIVNSNIGLAHLITPENLNEKIKSSTGYYWVGNRTYYTQDTRQAKGHRDQLLLNAYNILYGGMDSLNVVERTSELNGIMANIQLRMAAEMSCKITPIDFYVAAGDRKMFPFVEKDLEPVDEESIVKIKENIQYLHKHFLNEDLAIDDPQLELTYDLFFETYEEGKANVAATTESRNLNCRLTRDPVTGNSLSGAMQISTDDNYVIRSWAIVVAYMLSDYKYLYDNTAQ